MSVTRVPYPSAQPVYDAARRWRDRCILADKALFADGTLFADNEGSRLADAQALVRDFVDQPDLGSGDFLTKLRGQLAASGPGPVQLAAELLYVHLLIAHSEAVTGGRKREIVNRVLQFASNTTPLPADLARALDSGLVRPGQAFNSYRWRLFGYFIEVFTALKAVPLEQRRRLMSDPDAFVTFLDGINDQGALIQRHALEHLLFPDDFPPIVSQEHRRQILLRWPEHAGGITDSEPRRISKVMHGLADGSGNFVHLYQAPWLWQWSKPTEQWTTFARWAAVLAQDEQLGDLEREYKLDVAGRTKEALDAAAAYDPRWPSLLRTAFTKDNNLVAWEVWQPFVAWAENKPSDAAAALAALQDRPGSIASIDAFLDRLPDEVGQGSGARLSIASFLLSGINASQFPTWRAWTVDQATRLAGLAKPQPTATDGERYELYLRFLDQVIQILGTPEHAIALHDRLDAQGLVWALVSGDIPPTWPPARTEAIGAWRSGRGGPPPAVHAELPIAIPTATTTENADVDLADVADKLYLDEPFIDEIIQLIRDRGQVIFYGPPGTGKTHIARELAAWMTQSTSRVRLVQFHPSYAYEDFIEGLRPREDAGGFRLVSGPLIEMADQATADPNHDYVLVIDELNRGNVARVFGELYFLLEYRNQPARLLYSQREFRLPPNLYIIGTMNTADRSIALLDTALRRRFYFVPFRPDEAPISGVLRTYLQHRHESLVWVADAVDHINTKLADPAASIGPSYFIREDLDVKIVERAWKYSIMPTLEEHFYGQPGRLQEFTLDQVRVAINGFHDDDPAA